MRIRKRRRIRWNGAVTSPVATRPNKRWSMDFVSDCVSRGKVIRMLTIVDDCTRECPVIYLARRTPCASSAGSDCEPARTAGGDCCGQRTGVSRPGTGGLDRTTRCAAGVHSARQARAECLHRELQRPTARRMSERELVHQPQRCTAKDRNLAAGLQLATSAQIDGLLVTRRVCTSTSGDAGMRKLQSHSHSRLSRQSWPLKKRKAKQSTVRARNKKPRETPGLAGPFPCSSILKLL